MKSFWIHVACPIILQCVKIMDKFHQPKFVVLAPPTYVLRVWIWKLAHMHGLEVWESKMKLRCKEWTFEAWYQSELPFGHHPYHHGLLDITWKAKTSYIPHEINIRSKVLVPLVKDHGISSYPMHASFHFIKYFLQSSIHHTRMDREFKNLCHASKHM